MQTQTRIVNKNCVIAEYEDGVALAEAKREKPGKPWVIRKTHFGFPNALHVATVEPTSSEVFQRKMVLAILDWLS